MKAVLELKSCWGYVSQKTVESLISFLKKNDVGFHENKQRGFINNTHIEYVCCSLQPITIRDLLTTFIQKYEYVRFNLLMIEC